jgi:hypothetical protein
MTDPAAQFRADAQSFAKSIAEEADRLLQLAAERRLLLRLTGSLAIRAHSATSSHLLETLGRRPYRDIDLMGVWKQKRDVGHLFEERGYVADPEIKQAQEFGVKRLIYEHPATAIKIDVFMDDLVMAHTVPFGGRLELDGPTICVTDLLLSKLQIHEITENDLIDLVVLLADHGLGRGGREEIDDGYIASLMAKDWGFWYTTVANLEKLGAATPSAAASRASGRASTSRPRADGGSSGHAWAPALAGTKRSKRSTGDAGRGRASGACGRARQAGRAASRGDPAAPPSRERRGARPAGSERRVPLRPAPGRRGVG